MPSFLYASDSGADIRLGKRIYQYGLLSTGEPLQGVLHGDVIVSGQTAACINCHNRSGLGSIEGQSTILDISGKTLFNDSVLKARRYAREQAGTAHAERPAYTEATLLDALTHGTRSNGKRLDGTMPKFSLTDTDYSNLYAYLGTLSSRHDKGVSETVFHISTVIDEQADAEKVSTMLTVLEQFIKEYNTETRFETRRAKNSPIQKEWHYQHYRKLKLHVWRLDGPVEGWYKQLEQYNDMQPVFSIVSGISDRSWQPVHNFCNTYEIPCIFPTSMLPGSSEENYYALYYSQGILLEARVLASHIVSTPGYSARSILQIHDDTQVNRSAADAFGASILNADTGKPVSLISENLTTNCDDSMSGINLHDYKIIVLWLDPESLIDVGGVLKECVARNQYVYTSSLLSDDPPSRKYISDLSVNVFSAHPYVMPDRLNTKLKRQRVWSDLRNLDIRNKRVMGDAFTSIMILGNALKHLRGSFYRDYVMELLEHRVGNAVVTSSYPRLTIGPGQRYASKGSYVVKLGNDDLAPMTPVSPWIVPDADVSSHNQ